MTAPSQSLSGRLSTFLACVTGLIAANIYYAQPLVGPIGESLGLSHQAAGLIVTLTQVGYGAGLLLIVPLGDLFENRKLALTLIAVAAAGLLGAALSPNALLFLASAGLIGLGSVAVQVLVPYAAHMAPETIRGRVVGNVMSGLMLGIMLARPVASVIAEYLSWRDVFWLSAAAMIAVSVVLGVVMPRRVPPSTSSYRDLLASMVELAAGTPVLQRRAIYHACLFAAFSLFWTAVPLLLAGPVFQLSQGGIALFALAGVAGAFATPIAGRVADRGWSGVATTFAMLLVALAFIVTRIASIGAGWGLGLLVVAAVLLDFGVAANLTLGQRAIFTLGAEHRGRLNGLYMATFFVGGAIGSAVGAWSYALDGWVLTAWIGFALPCLGLFLHWAVSTGKSRRGVSVCG